MMEDDTRHLRNAMANVITQQAILIARLEAKVDLQRLQIKKLEAEAGRGKPTDKEKMNA